MTISTAKYTRFQTLKNTNRRDFHITKVQYTKYIHTNIIQKED